MEWTTEIFVGKHFFFEDQTNVFNQRNFQINDTMNKEYLCTLLEI